MVVQFYRGRAGRIIACRRTALVWDSGGAGGRPLPALRCPLLAARALPAGPPGLDLGIPVAPEPTHPQQDDSHGKS
jgi:hypothetical protein